MQGMNSTINLIEQILNPPTFEMRKEFTRYKKCIKNVYKQFIFFLQTVVSLFSLYLVRKII